MKGCLRIQNFIGIHKNDLQCIVQCAKGNLFMCVMPRFNIFMTFIIFWILLTSEFFNQI